MNLDEQITKLMLLIPTAKELAPATPEQLKQLRAVSNMIDNQAYLEILRRKKVEVQQ